MENAAIMEKVLETLGTELQTFIAQGDKINALKTFRAMKNITGGCKLRLLGIMMRLSKSTLRGSLEAMEKKAGEAVKIVLEREAYTERAAMLAKALGRGAVKFGGRALGLVGFVIIAKDVMDCGNYLADSMAEQICVKRIAFYGDYLDERESAGLAEEAGLASVKTYRQWLATEYFPAEQEKKSQFFKQIKTLFPHSVPV